MIAISNSEELAKGLSRFFECILHVHVELFLKSNCIIWNGLNSSVHWRSTIQFHLVLVKNAEEALNVDSSLLVFPKVVHEAIQLLFVDFQIKRVENLCKLLTIDIASSSSINQLEQVA